MLEKLAQLAEQYQETNERLSHPDTISDVKLFNRLSKENAKLTEIAELYHKIEKVNQELSDNQELIDDPQEDKDIKELAKEEIKGLKEQFNAHTDQAQILLLPKNPDDNKNAILEIRAGTGGDEASLFVADLFKAYTRFAEKRKWKIDILDSQPTELGGFKEISMLFEGKDCFGIIKYEAGTHRVQRIPTTETQGRVHTSAITVAVLPESEEIEIDIKTQDLRIDTYRSQGAGGQHVNTTDSAIRITHLPTGIVVTCQEERSQIKNRGKAMKHLKAKLYETEITQQNKEEAQLRKSMVGSGDRSERIRTYNYPQGRITDHRIKLTLYRLDDIMAHGDFDEISNALARFDQEQKLQNQLQD